MPASTKIIKKRIGSISNTKKITKAMEMVSAAKMRRATENVLKTRPYSNLAWQIIENISKSGGEIAHPLLEEKDVKTGKKLIILVASDKGLCGSFNSQMFREIKKFINSSSVISTETENKLLDFIVTGKKGERFISREKLNFLAAFHELTNNPSFNDVKPIAKLAMDGFMNNTYDEVYLAYTDYVSTLVQNPNIRQLLPIIKDKKLGSVDKNEEAKEESLSEDLREYIFEPKKEELLKLLLPKIVETQIYQAILESIASEHSSRMVAMKNATDAANDMVRELTLTFNKIRQASITQEISEISAGKAALE